MSAARETAVLISVAASRQRSSSVSPARSASSTRTSEHLFYRRCSVARRCAGFITILFVALAGLPGPGQAASVPADASDPACAARPSIGLATAPEVAVGRPVEIVVTDDLNALRSSLASRVVVRLGDRVRVILYRGLGAGVPETQVALDLGLAPRAQRLKVRASWLDRVEADDPLEDDSLCARSTSILVRVTPGRVPRLRSENEPFGEGTFGWELPTPFREDCTAISAAGPVVVEMGRRRLLWRRDVCDDTGQDRAVAGPGWRLEVLGGTTAWLSFRDDGPTRQVLPYTIRVGRVILERGAVTARRAIVAW